MTGQRSPIPARFPWEKLYIATVLEADNVRKPERIKIAEETLVARSLELKDNAEMATFRQLTARPRNPSANPVEAVCISPVVNLGGRGNGFRHPIPQLSQLLSR